MTREAREALFQYDWPENVSRAPHRARACGILCEVGPIAPQHLSLESSLRLPRSSETTDLGTMERETIAKVLQDCRWNKSAAARRLGLSRTQLYIRMRTHSLEEAVPA